MLAARNRNSRHATIGESVIGGGVMAVDLNNGQIEDTGPDSYENLLDDYSHFATPAADEVLQGTVLSVTATDVIVDFGYKSEGIVPIEQFRNPDGNITVQRGDPVDVMIDHGGEQPEGYVLRSEERRVGKEGR